jgi:hypothetical protein
MSSFLDSSPDLSERKIFFHDSSSPNENIEENTLDTTIDRHVNSKSPPSTEEKRRELEASEHLAWQLMQEESINAYQMQLEYIRSNPDMLTEEEIQSLNLFLNENEALAGEMNEYLDETPDESDSSDPNMWSYDQLLELGRAVGGKSITGVNVILHEKYRC